MWFLGNYVRLCVIKNFVYLIIFASGTMCSANSITSLSYVAEKNSIWHFGDSCLQLTDFIKKYRSKSTNTTYLWIRIHWSWWPCVAIITSASSKTKTRIFFKSMTRYFRPQSRTFPGVPIIIWSFSFVPGTTNRRRYYVNLYLIKYSLIRCI